VYTLSDHVASFGLEHHESSDDRTGERTLIDADALRASADLLPHEFVHSWNGKYRRPSGLISGGHDGGYDTPMKGDLLWVYEGLTQYLGEILTPRSGLWSPEDYRESLAETAAELPPGSFDHYPAAQCSENRHASRYPFGSWPDEVDDYRCPRWVALKANVSGLPGYRKFGRKPICNVPPCMGAVKA
jgi:predicted metalloprotease with PDZ domain